MISMDIDSVREGVVLKEWFIHKEKKKACFIAPLRVCTPYATKV